jgi:hypothetical protein
MAAGPKNGCAVPGTTHKSRKCANPAMNSVRWPRLSRAADGLCIPGLSIPNLLTRWKP